MSKLNNPYKAIFGEYKRVGAYYKIFMMYKKLVLVGIFIAELKPDVEATGYILQYFFFILIEFLFMGYMYKFRPYYGEKNNLLTMGSTTSNMIFTFLNLMLVRHTEEDSDGELCIVII